MSDLRTNDPLETIVGDALRADATAAPELAAEWIDAPGVLPAPRTPTRTRWVPAVFGAAAAALLLVALVVVAGQRNESAPVATPPWSPPGEEFASSDLGPATMVFGGPVVAALTRQVVIEGHPPQIISTSIAYYGHATALEQVCTSHGASSGCRPEWVTTSWSTSMTSSVDNGDAIFDLWTIEGLPANTAFVSYNEGDLALWQRPIMGFAAFPNVPGEEQVVIAYALDGTEIGRFGAEQQAATQSAGAAPLQADLSTRDVSNLSELTSSTMRDCLTMRGGTLDGDVATFPPEIDQIVVWDECVAETKQIVGDAVTELNPRFYDPVTEQPQNEDSVGQSVGGSTEPGTGAPDVSVDFTNTDIALDADGWRRTSFTPADLGFVGPAALFEAQFSDGAGRNLQVDFYAGGSDGFLVRTQGEYPPLPPEEILTLDEFEQVASYPSGDRFRYNRLLDDDTVLEIAGSGFEDVESFLEIVALVATSLDQQ